MVRMLSGCATLLVFVALVIPSYGREDDPKPDKKADQKEVAPTAEKMLNAGQVSGKIISMDESKIKVEVTLHIPKIDAGAANALAQAQVEYQNASLGGGNAAQKAQKMQAALNKIAQQQQKLYTYEKKTETIELQTVEKVVVRAAQPPPSFDEKGSPKSYTKKELDDLKGPDKKLPGYTSEFSSLTEGQTVTISLSKKKEDKSAEKPPKFKTEEEKHEWVMAHLPKVSMIVITAEPVKKN